MRYQKNLHGIVSDGQNVLVDTQISMGPILKTEDQDRIEKAFRTFQNSVITILHNNPDIKQIVG